MKKTITLFFAICTSLFGLAQEHKEEVKKQEVPDVFHYKFQADAGVGASIYAIVTTLNLQRSAAFSTGAKVNLLYNVKESFSVGLHFASNKFKTDPDTTANFANANNTIIAILFNYHLVDKKKFNFYLGSGLGVSQLKYERQQTDGTTGEITMEGPSLMLNAGMRFYFIKNLGLFFQPGFVVNPYRISSFTINGQEQDTIGNYNVDDVTFALRGVNVSLGLSLRF